MTLTSSLFTSRILTFITRREVSRYNAGEKTGSYRLTHVLADVQRYARYNEEDGIPAAYGLTAYGIAWAIETGRINGATHIALKAMTVATLLKLIYKVHSHVTNMGEIPAYLMSLELQPVC